MSAAQPGVIQPLPPGHDQGPAPNPVPEHMILVAFAFEGEEVDHLRQTFAALRAVVEQELTAQLAGRADETGELGFDGGHGVGGLTITLGLSKSGFDRLGVDPAQHPADLREIPWDALGDEPAIRASGDLVLKVCSDDIYVCDHVIRRVEKELAGALSTVWAQVGVQRFGSNEGPLPPDSSRALIGFRDGTSNLKPRTNPADRAFVLVNPDPAVIKTYPGHPASEPDGGPIYPDDLHPVPDHEPDWTLNGTYMTVRVSVFDTTKWDALKQDEQEQAVGRHKVSGASLDLADDDAQLKTPPAFLEQPENTAVPLTAHVRKAFPMADGQNMYRHSYSLVSSGADHRMARGLAFIAFARTISAQFEFIFRGQMRNKDFPHVDAGIDRMLFTSLSEHVLCGGYYFVPAVEDPARAWTWTLPIGIG